MVIGALEQAGSACRGQRRPSVEHVSDIAGLRRLRPEWNGLLCRSPASSVFLTWEWIATWWEHFGREGDLLILAVRDESGRLVGLAPL